MGKMTSDDWHEMERNDYAPNPVPMWTEYVALGAALLIGTGLCAFGAWLIKWLLAAL